MKRIMIMDCTMRDGGWVNEFDFGTDGMRDILKTEEGAGIEFIELGYLDQNKGFYRDKTMYANYAALEEGFAGVRRSEGTTRLVMIDCGKFDAEKLPKHVPGDTAVIDGIRLCFHKKDTEKAISFGKKLLDRGFRLFVQPMVTSRYSDDDIKKLIETVQDELKGFEAFYIVDSFGVLHEKEICERLLLADAYLEQDIMLGLHTHNNLNLCMEDAKGACALAQTGESDRPARDKNMLHPDRRLILDATLDGLGKGPGNLVTEEIASYLNETFDNGYDLNRLNALSARLIKPLRNAFEWGYAPEYELSSRYAATPTYARIFCREYKRSLQELEVFFKNMPENKKDSFDRKFAEEYLRKLKH